MRASNADIGNLSSSHLAPRWQRFMSAAILFRETENPASIAEDTDGAFVLSPLPDSGGSALASPTRTARYRSPCSEIFGGFRFRSARNHRRGAALSPQMRRRRVMKKTFAVLATVAALGVTAVAAPAEARGRGIGPGLAFGLAAGAITAGAIAASHPYGYGYGPGYGYYGGPAYYDYGPGPYAYYGGGPYYRHHHYYYRHW
jgi:hypothetical protein